MKKKIFILVIVILFIFPVLLESKKKTPKDLPGKYRKWLEEEVVYIITPKEKDIFLRLETDRERDIFIKAFWRQRDPTPGTPKNENKEEHYRRIAYANKFFGRGTPRPGWKTDRGKIYIILGSPIDIDRYGEDYRTVYPTEVWFYQGETKYGLPAHFNVVFYKKKGIGEYKLYSPASDGPYQLLINYKGDATNIAAMYEEIFEYDPILAQASLSLIPGERPFPGHVSLTSDIVLGNIVTLPHKKVEDEYAKKLLKYKDIVEVEYTANYIYSDSLVKIIKDKSGIFFVHYSIEPKTLSIGSYEDKYYTNFKINGKVSDLKGRTIFQYEKTISLEFTKDQLNNIKSESYAIQDMIPLVPGNYKFNVLLKNTVAKEFTSFEKDITIPDDASALQMSSLLLSYKTEKSSSRLAINKPFRVGNYQIYTQPKKVFLPKEKLSIFFQVLSLTKELRENGSVKFTFYKGDEEFSSTTKRINEYQDKTDFLEEFSLQNFPPAHYQIKVSILDTNKNEILFEKEYFDVTPVAGIARPWIFSKVMPASHNIEYLFMLGNQLLNKGDIKGARALLERTYQKNPNSLRYAFGFSRVLFTLKEYHKVKDVLLPFLNTKSKNYEFLGLLGKSCQALGEFEEAVTYYKNYLSHYGTNLEILNSIGKCYYQLGNKEEALVAWEKSLEINPEQEKLKKLVESIKK
ncbi:MAG: GWxTD domain-containing protein [Candidatus Aminicenantia bacterium]